MGEVELGGVEAVLIPFGELFFGCVFVDVGEDVGHVDGVEAVAVGDFAYAAGYPVGLCEAVFVAEGVEVCLAGFLVVLPEELDVGFVHVSYCFNGRRCRNSGARGLLIFYFEGETGGVCGVEAVKLFFYVFYLYVVEAVCFGVFQEDFLFI